MNRYLDAVKKAGQDLHSIMIVQHGNVIAEEWMGEGKEDEPHILNSVSKTFTATAVGLAASEGRLKLTDKVISFFPDKLPATVSENLAAMTVRDLLTMNCGHDTDPTGTVRKRQMPIGCRSSLPSPWSTSPVPSTPTTAWEPTCSQPSYRK